MCLPGPRRMVLQKGRPADTLSGDMRYMCESPSVNPYLIMGMRFVINLPGDAGESREAGKPVSRRHSQGPRLDCVG